MRLEKKILPCRDLTLQVSYQGFIERKLLFFLWHFISCHISAENLQQLPRRLRIVQKPSSWPLLSLFETWPQPTSASSPVSLLSSHSDFFQFLKRSHFSKASASHFARGHLHLLPGKLISLTRPCPSHPLCLT